MTGGRSGYDHLFVKATLNQLRPTFIATGECPTGVDQQAKLYAMEKGIFYAGFPAPWKKGPSAGPARNRVMLETIKPDLVVAFPGGAGTENTTKTARALGIEVVYYFKKEPEGENLPR